MSFVIGVAGGSGSGKTTIVRRLVDELGPGQAAVIAHDSYYRPDPRLSWEERVRINYDHPDSLQTRLLIRHLDRLKRGRAAEIPTYDFTRHQRLPETRLVKPHPVLILEGILVLCNRRLRRLLDLRVFVSTDDDLRFIRRLQRDLTERGRTVESVIRQYLATVKPLHQRYVEPSRRHAHLILSGQGPVNTAVEVLATRLRSELTPEPIPN